MLHLHTSGNTSQIKLNTPVHPALKLTPCIGLKWRLVLSGGRDSRMRVLKLFCTTIDEVLTADGFSWRHCSGIRPLGIVNIYHSALAWMWMWDFVSTVYVCKAFRKCYLQNALDWSFRQPPSYSPVFFDVAIGNRPSLHQVHRWSRCGDQSGSVECNPVI